MPAGRIFRSYAMSQLMPHLKPRRPILPLICSDLNTCALQPLFSPQSFVRQPSRRALRREATLLWMELIQRADHRLCFPDAE